MQERPYTVAQLAAYWQCSDTFIYDRINAGSFAPSSSAASSGE